jgi:hypothetical protein
MAESILSNLAWGRPTSVEDVAGMTINRLTSLNLVYIIKEKILPLNGYVSRFSETLSPTSQDVDQDTGLTVTQYKASFTDFVYHNPDPSNPALTGLLTAPILNITTDLAWTDFPNGAVYYSGVKNNTINIEYDYYTVSVQDGFPDWGEDIVNLEDVRLPLVSVDMVSRNNNPFALGGTYEELRNFMVNITANSDPQRNDLMEIIETSLRYNYPNTINYNLGFPIIFNGDKNQYFDRGPGSRWKNIRFKEASSKILRNPLAPEKLRHQGNVFVQIQIV